MYSFRFLFLTLILCYSQARSVPEEHESYEDQLDRIVEEMSDCLDKNLEPIMSKLSESDQSQWKELGISALSSYVRHLGMIVEREQYPEHRRPPLRRLDWDSDSDEHDEEYPPCYEPSKQYGFRLPHIYDDSSEEDSSEEFKVPCY